MSDTVRFKGRLGDKECFVEGYARIPRVGDLIRNFEGCVKIVRHRLGDEAVVVAEWREREYPSTKQLLDAMRPGWAESLALERGGWYDSPQPDGQP